MVLSPQVCYVCGGPGGVLFLQTRPSGNGAYFPFLESHEAPNGARAPTKDGIVDACNICFAFLQQQWESYERTHTPLVKRLYWLKRLDSRPFTGAEMRLQGEYAAQVMGLQYYPSNTGTMSPYEYSPIDAQKEQQKSEASGKCSPSSIPETLHGTDDFEEDDTGALDLSLTSSTSKDDSMSEFKNKSVPLHAADKFTCYTCKSVHDIVNRRNVYSKFVKSGEPFFSFLTQFTKSATHGHSKGIYQLCKVCQETLYEQWNIFEMKNLPEHMRNYCIKNEPVFSNKSKSQDVACGNEYQATGSSSSDHCYLCGQSNQRTSMKMLNARPPQEKSSKHSMFFPFIHELKRPSNARPIDQFGRVATCRACYSYLQRQWQSYQQEKIAAEQRRYVLRPLTENDTSKDVPIIKKEEDVGSDLIGANNLTDPLNIEITTSTSATSSKSKHVNSFLPPVPNPNQGLLAIAPHIPQPMMLPGLYHPGHIFYNSFPGMYNMSGSSSGITGNSNQINHQEGHARIKEEKPEGKMEKDALPPLAVNKANDKDDVNIDSCDQDMYNGNNNQQPREGPQPSVTPASPVVTSVPLQQYDQLSPTSDTSTSNAPNSRPLSQSSTGLTAGAKPPPLNMVNPSVPRTTVTVPPLNPVSPGSSITSTAALSSSRQQQHSSSFAAALRKLAKQAEGPESSPIDPTSTSDSSGTSPRESSEINIKRGGSQSMSYNAPHLPLGGGVPTVAPPVVTIAPTQSHNSFLGSERKSADRTPTGSMLDPLGIKPERDKVSASHDRRDDDRPHSKDSAAISSRMTPHSVMPSVTASSSLHEDPSRGFQPYRPGDDPLRHAMASGLAGIDPAAYSAAYAQAAVTAAALAGGYPPTGPYSPAQLRLDDPLLLERYRLMQSSVAGYPYAPSGLMAPPGSLSQYLASSRYPPELLSQMGYPYPYPVAKLPEHLSPGSAERLKAEDEARREREIEREREKDRERREKEERERDRAIERERERERERQIEKDRQLKEAERRLSTGSSSGSGYSAERLLLGGPSAYPQPPPAHEPLNLKRSSEDDHHSSTSSSHHLSSSSASSHHGGGHTSHPRVAAPAHSNRQLNGDRDIDRHLSSYRAELNARGEPNSRSGIPTLGVAPLSIPKPHNLSSSQNKDIRNSESTHHSFHRPFEIPVGHSSSVNSSASSTSIPAVTNGYDRDSFAEFERRLIMEREKMLAEHRASQEKLQQQRTSRNESSSSSIHDHHRGSSSHADSKHRAGYPGTDGKDRIDHHHHRDREVSREKSLNLSSSHQQQHHHHHHSNNHDKHSSSSSVHKSPHKSLLPPSGNSTSSNNNNKYPPSVPHSSHHHQFPFSNMSTKKDSNSKVVVSESQALPKQLHYNDNAKLGTYSTYTSSQSALTSLQNFSNSKVPSSFGSVIHSVESAEEHQRKMKESGSVMNHTRLNGAFPSHTRSHNESSPSSADGGKRKDVSLQHHNKLNSVRSPKRVRQLLSSPFSKDKLEDGEPAIKRLHMADLDNIAERDGSLSADDLNREPDYRQKARFLFELQLEPVAAERRKELEFCQKVCEWDKIRRENMFGIPPAPNNVDSIPVPNNQYCSARLAQVVSEALLNKKNSPTVSGNNNNITKTTNIQESANSSPTTTTASTNNNSNSQQPVTRSVIYPQHPSTIEGKPLLSHHFAQEFHESVLKETQQQRANKGYSNKHENSNQDVRYTLISSDSTLSQPNSKQQPCSTNNNQIVDNDHPLLPSSLQSMQNMTSQLLVTDSSNQASAHNLMTSHHKAMTSPHGSQHSLLSDTWEDHTPVLKWPGVEAVMMAYQKHIEEVNTEKQILQEQCESLKKKNLQLGKNAEDLSNRMSDLLQNKQKSEDERKTYQTQLDSLRKLLSALKR